VLLNGSVRTRAKVGYTDADLVVLAGQRSFDRGVGYLKAVTNLAVHGDKITASVAGSDNYVVMLTLGGNGGSGPVSGDCDCPHGREGFFCKHCVAVGLAYLGQVLSNSHKSSKTAQASPPDPSLGQASGLHPWLTSLDRDDLVSLVLDQLVEDDDWRYRLELRAATAACDLDVIVSRLARLLDESNYGDFGYVEEGESARYARRVAAAASVLRELTRSGHAPEAVAVADLAVKLVVAARRHAADPAGAIKAAATDLLTTAEKAISALEDTRQVAELVASDQQLGA
jgi:SWIM zinc finger